MCGKLGIRHFSQDPDSCVCDPAALDSLSLRLNRGKGKKTRPARVFGQDQDIQ